LSATRPKRFSLPEYTYPGVYIEEISFRAKAIDGVATFLLGVALGVAASIAAENLRRRCRAT
jgi:hypothetical protein